MDEHQSVGSHGDHTPPYGTAAPSDTLGVRHIELALADLPFPATKEELLERAGNWRVPITGEHQVPLAELLEGVDKRRFRNPQAVSSAVAAAHPELRER